MIDMSFWNTIIFVEKSLKVFRYMGITIIEVLTGQVKVLQGSGFLKASAIGSCIGLTAYDPLSTTGGVAHIMLPGKSPKTNKNEENKYTENAITNLLNELEMLGASNYNLKICIVGGANVLKKENDFVGLDVVNSIANYLKKKNLILLKSSLGGYERRSAKLILESGIVNYTIGDSPEKILCDFNK